MHLQVRCQPKASPPDVAALLDRLARENVDLVGIGGSDVEFNGELAVVPAEDDEDRTIELLQPYRPRVVRADDPDSGLTLLIVDDRSGGLYEQIRRHVAPKNQERGWVIRDILIGVPNEEQKQANQVPVHVFSEPAGGQSAS